MLIRHLETSRSPESAVLVHDMEVQGVPSILEARALALTLVSKLASRKEKISIAESCTGGLIGNFITDIPGSSSVFEIGIISYSNDAKYRLLGVSPQTLDTRGAVSSECVASMANGVRLLAKADYGIAVSGIAGPTGATGYKPVGVVYFGFSSNNDNVYARIYFENLSRVDTKFASAYVALSLASYMIGRTEGESK